MKKLLLDHFLEIQMPVEIQLKFIYYENESVIRK